MTIIINNGKQTIGEEIQRWRTLRQKLRQKMISTSHIKSCDNNKHCKIDDWRRQIKMDDAETEAEAKNDFNKSQQKL